ncbi:MAG: PAS domain S-box protein [Desulfuromonadales bacterium]|nr:PAS domain S-box protein [Desulfuromonadales bacterium]MBN2790908.1 PAS domain S-box protein [Desulfuromonadales bacterium]
MTEKDLFHRILEGTPDGVLFADQEGIIRYWNEGARRIFGYSKEEALGASLDLIIPEKLRDRHWSGYHHVMETGVSRYSTELLLVPALHKDGHQLSCEFSIVMIHDDSGRIIGFASIMRDVTERWEKEKELRKQLAACKKTQ